MYVYAYVHMYCMCFQCMGIPVGVCVHAYRVYSMCMGSCVQYSMVTPTYLSTVRTYPHAYNIVQLKFTYFDLLFICVYTLSHCVRPLLCTHALVLHPASWTLCVCLRILLSPLDERLQCMCTCVDTYIRTHVCTYELH